MQDLHTTRSPFIKVKLFRSFKLSLFLSPCVVCYLFFFWVVPVFIHFTHLKSLRPSRWYFKPYSLTGVQSQSCQTNHWLLPSSHSCFVSERIPKVCEIYNSKRAYATLLILSSWVNLLNIKMSPRHPVALFPSKRYIRATRSFSMAPILYICYEYSLLFSKSLLEYQIQRQNIISSIWKCHPITSMTAIPIPTTEWQVVPRLMSLVSSSQNSLKDFPLLKALISLIMRVGLAS